MEWVSNIKALTFDLFGTVMDIRGSTLPATRAFLEKKNSPQTAEQFWAALRDFMTRAIAFMQEHPTTVALMKGALSMEGTGSSNAAMREVKQMYRQWAEAFVTQGQALGAIRSDLPYDLLIAITIGVATSGDIWVAEHFEELDTADWDLLSDQFLDLFRHGLEP